MQLRVGSTTFLYSCWLYVDHVYRVRVLRCLFAFALFVRTIRTQTSDNG